MVGDGIVQVQFDGNAFSFLVAPVATPMSLVEVTEQRLPRLFGCRLARQLHHRLRNHGIGLGLVVPAVFHPESGLSVPLGHAGRVYPRYPSGVNATPDTNGLVGADKEFWRLSIKLAEEHSVAVYSIVEQLDSGRRAEVRLFPCTELPHHAAVLVHLDGLHGSVGRVHGLLVPFVEPVVNEMVAIFQPYRLLRLCHTIVSSVQLPDGLPLAVDLLNQTFASRDEQIAGLGHLLHRPRQEAAPAVHLLAITGVFVDAAQRHVGHEQCAAARQAGIAELSVHRALFAGWEFELPDDVEARNLHHHSLGGASVLHKYHVGAADGLDGVYLSSLRRSILPDGLSVSVHFGHAILMSHKDMPVCHQHGIADFATAQSVPVTPADLSVLDYEHTALLALPRIKEIVS